MQLRKDKVKYMTQGREIKTKFYTREMAMEYFHLGRDRTMDLAREAGAVIRYGRRVLIDIEKCESYLRREYTE